MAAISKLTAQQQAHKDRMDALLKTMRPESAVRRFCVKQRRDGVRDITLRNGYVAIIRTFLKSVDLSEVEATIDEIKAIPEEKWQEFLDGYSGNSHNTRLNNLNKFRRFCGLENLDRKRHSIVDREPLDLNKAASAFEKMMDLPYLSERDVVILNIFYYGGLRLEEIVELKRECFTFHDGYCHLHFFRPKTGTWGDIDLVEPTAILRKYCSHAPTPFLKAKQGGAITENGIQHLIKRVSKDIGIPFHPHLFRHVAATTMAKEGLGERDLNNYFGWSTKSRTASIYTNLSTEETNKKVRAKRGLVVKDDLAKIVKKCKRCSEIIPSTSSFCVKCGTSVDWNPSKESSDLLTERMKRKAMEAKMFELELKFDRLLELRGVLRDGTKTQDEREVADAEYEYEEEIIENGEDILESD